MLLKLAARPLVQTFNMLMTFNYSLRAMTCNLLGLSKDVKAAEYVTLRFLSDSS
jgi:hypothetical protein